MGFFFLPSECLLHLWSLCVCECMCRCKCMWVYVCVRRPRINVTYHYSGTINLLKSINMYLFIRLVVYMSVHLRATLCMEVRGQLSGSRFWSGDPTFVVRLSDRWLYHSSHLKSICLFLGEIIISHFPGPCQVASAGWPKSTWDRFLSYQHWDCNRGVLHRGSVCCSFVGVLSLSVCLKGKYIYQLTCLCCSICSIYHFVHFLLCV